MPLPGDMLRAKIAMRAWETEDHRGMKDEWILANETALVVSVWTVGGQARIKAFTKMRLMLFSCPTHVFLRNWAMVSSTVEGT